MLSSCLTVILKELLEPETQSATASNNEGSADSQGSSTNSAAVTGTRESELPNQTAVTTVDQQSVKIKYEEYKRIMNVLIHRLRKLEEEAEQEAAERLAQRAEGQQEATAEAEQTPADQGPEITPMETTEDGSADAEGATAEQQDDLSDIGGSKRSELVNWYLESISDEIESVSDLELWRTKIEKIITRLIDHEHAVIAIVPSEGATSEAAQSQNDPFLVVHPNFMVEE